MSRNRARDECHAQPSLAHRASPPTPSTEPEEGLERDPRGRPQLRGEGDKSSGRGGSLRSSPHPRQCQSSTEPGGGGSLKQGFFEGGLGQPEGRDRRSGRIEEEELAFAHGPREGHAHFCDHAIYYFLYMYDRE